MARSRCSNPATLPTSLNQSGVSITTRIYAPSWSSERAMRSTLSTGRTSETNTIGPSIRYSPRIAWSRKVLQKQTAEHGESAMDLNEQANGKLKPRTLVVGLGEVGAALAAILDRKETVLRHDLDRVKIEEPIGTMHLCIPFQSPHQFETVALGYMSRFAPALTIINSTVIPGTTRSIAKKSGSAVAYSPVRGKHVKMEQDLLHYVKFVAAPERADAARAEAHFQAAGMKTRR